VNDDADDPNDSSTDGLEDSTIDSTERVSDKHAVTVVEEHCAAEEENCHDEILVRSKADEGIDGVLERVVLHGGVVGARDHVSDGTSEDDHEDCAPETLETDNTERRQIKILKKELLSHDLAGLHDLRQDDKANTEQDVASAVVALGLGDEETGSTDDAKGDEAGDNTNELMGLHATARKEKTRKNGGEDNHGATKHLEDGDGHINETVSHHGGGNKIEESGDSNDDRVLLLWLLSSGLNVDVDERLSVDALLVAAFVLNAIDEPAERGARAIDTNMAIDWKKGLSKVWRRPP